MRLHITTWGIATFLLMANATTVIAGTGDIHRVQDPVAGHYIVALKQRHPNLPAVAAALARAYNGKVGHVYGSAFPGFSFLGDESAAHALHADGLVEYVQESAQYTLMGTRYPAPSWGLDRIDEGVRVMDGWFGSTYTGVGVTIYVVDSGVNPISKEFGNRIVYAENFTYKDPLKGDFTVNPLAHGDCPSTPDPITGEIKDRDHGTWVASIAAGADYGVAPSATIVNLKAFACGRTARTEEVVAAITRMIERRQQGLDAPHAVANFSWVNTSGVDYAVEDAVQRALEAGIVIAAAGGPVGRDSCGYSPARMGDPTKYTQYADGLPNYDKTNPNQLSVITVGSTTDVDTMDPNSGYGPCIDIFAPGQRVKAIGASGNIRDAYDTSAATPHVSGVAAQDIQQYIASNIVGWNSKNIEGTIKDASTKDVLTGLGPGSINRLLRQGFPPRRRACCS